LNRFLTFLLLPLSLFAIEVQPWFGDVYEFHLLSSYAYSRFDKVEGAEPPLGKIFQANLIYLGLDFSLSPEWSIDADFQLADTTAQSFNVRSTAIQARYLWLDDIIGDRVSLSTGANMRFTPTHALHDVSCPSHANLDFEANVSIGKEFEATYSWLFRAWAFAAIGHGNRGSPWVRAIAAIETNINDQHKLGLFAEGINGYGRHSHINVNDFDGYAKFRNKAIDLSIRYGCRVGVWGTLRFEYIRRVLAKSCPENVNTWTIGYLLPFSF
jgi:hypothetical protein